MKIVQRVAIVAAIAGALGFAAGAHAGGPPFGAALADGKSMPLPYGISLTLYDQRQSYSLDRLVLGIPGFDNLPLERLTIDNHITESDVQMDVWLFPFLNVFGMIGNLDGRTDVDFSRLSLPFPFDRVAIDYSGEVYGVGATLAAGGDAWFTSLTAVATKTSLSGDFDSSAKSLVIMPRLGLHDDRGSIWLGAMYLKAEEQHSGIITLPFIGPVPFAVNLKEKNQWNGLAGAHADLAEHWTLELEGGFGARKSASATVAWRF